MNATGALYQAALTVTTDDDMARVTVRDTHHLELDEPSWSELGSDRAPCPMDYLLVGIAGCQLEVLRHYLERSRVEEYHVTVAAESEYDIPGDPESGIAKPTSNVLTAVHLAIDVDTPTRFERRVRRCVDLAEQNCIVTRSVEAGIDIPVTTTVHSTTGV